MTGLDFLRQRAGVARPERLPTAYASAIDGAGTSAVASARTSGLDMLMERAAAAAPAPSLTESATARSWAARGGPAVLMSSAGGTAASERRRAAGLAVLPEGGEQREAMAARLHEALGNGYAASTRRADEGYWKRWECFCKSIGTSPWRTDMAANSGMDPEGHQEEVFLLATAMLHVYERMCPRRHSDPAAHPNSSKKLIESVARSHLVRGIKMVSLEVVSLACKGLCREYIEEHDVHTLVP